MASAQAQAFFDKQSAADRMKIIDSWGGRDMTDEWFKNAQAAGSVPAAAAPGAAPSVADVRAQTQNASEDFARYDNATVEGWNKLYDAAASQAAGRPQYRSSRGAPGFFDKPTECPAGQSPSGPDESSPCKSNQELLAAQGAGQGGGQGAAGAAGAQGAQAGYFGQDDPLQRLLTNQLSAGAGSFAGSTSGGQFAGGGVFSEGAGQYGKPATTGTATPTANPAATAALGALAPAPAPAPLAAPAPEPASYSDPYEAWKQGGRKGPAPGSSALAAPVPTVFNAPAAPKPADVFGMAAPAGGSLAELVNPGRAKRDARMGGSWF